MALEPVAETSVLAFWDETSVLAFWDETSVLAFWESEMHSYVLTSIFYHVRASGVLVPQI